jgi:hypothetical protein
LAPAIMPMPKAASNPTPIENGAIAASTSAFQRASTAAATSKT